MASAGERAASGSFLLSIGNALSSAILAVGSIFIVRLLGPGDYGALGVALIYPSMLSILADLGFSIAITRYVSAGFKEHAVTAMWIRIFSGALFSMALFLSSPLLASTLYRPYIAPVIQILSLYMFSSMVQSSVSAYLMGLGRYLYTVEINIVSSVARVVVSIVLIAMGMGIYGAAYGFSIGYLAGAIHALYRLSSTHGLGINISRSSLKELVSYSTPLYIPSLLSIPLNQVYGILIAIYASNEDIGNYQVAGNLTTPLSIIASSISAALLSSLPMLLGRDQALREAVRKAASYTALAVSPLIPLLILFSREIIYIVYGEAYRDASLYLSIMALAYLTTPVNTVDVYLETVGDTKRLMFISIANAVVRLSIAWLLLARLGILGAVITLPVSSVIGSIIAVLVVRKAHSLSIGIRTTVRYMVPSIVSAMAAYAATLIPGNSASAPALSLTAYIVLQAFLTAVIVDRSDLEQIRLLLKGIRHLGPIVSRIIDIELMINSTISRKPRSSAEKHL